MKRGLKSIAMRLSESDIEELIRFRKQGGKRVDALRKKRDKLAMDLARLDKQIAKLQGDDAAAPKAAKRGRPGRKSAAAGKAGKKAASAKAPSRRGRKSGRPNLSAAVREIFAKAGEPLKARQVVEALPEAGIKVANEAKMLKDISVILATQKSHFERVDRGVYKLKE